MTTGRHERRGRSWPHDNKAEHGGNARVGATLQPVFPAEVPEMHSLRRVLACAAVLIVCAFVDRAGSFMQFGTAVLVGDY